MSLISSFRQTGILLREGLAMALYNLWVNRLRTLLSLTGITIGIFAIVAVFTAVDAIENSIRGGLESLGNDVLFIERWPWAPEEGDEEYAWWKYFQRPTPDLREVARLRERSELASHLCLMAAGTFQVARGNSTLNDAEVVAVTEGYDGVFRPRYFAGRYFTPQEVAGGKPLCVVGYAIAEALGNPAGSVGTEIKVGGQTARIIGVLEKQGEGLLGNNSDTQVIVPMVFGRRLIDLTGTETRIAAVPREGVSEVELKSELIGHLRALRQLRPGEPNNFAVNTSSLLNSGLDALFLALNAAGIIIGGFSMLVGGFSIANIMFVSVRERTAQIGIQKALGARRNFIVFQFLIEAVALSVLGGMLGLGILLVGTAILSAVAQTNLLLSLENALIGLAFSAGVGLISGLLPAISAARLQPVEAIRTGI